jgi:hypothetical protein
MRHVPILLVLALSFGASVAVSQAQTVVRPTHCSTHVSAGNQCVSPLGTRMARALAKDSKTDRRDTCPPLTCPCAAGCDKKCCEAK